jgi:ribosome-associated translation inhibitor RaiA
MRHNIEFKGFEPQESIGKLIEDLTKKLEKRAGRLSSEVVFLRVLVERNSVRKLYHASLTLELPGKTLASKEEKHDLEATLRDAFAEIERQLEKYIAKVRRDHWKRPARREQIRQMKISAARSEPKQP